MQKAHSSLALPGEGPVGPGKNSAKSATTRASSIGFIVVCALVVFSVGFSIHLEMKIRSAAAELERLRSNRASAPDHARTQPSGDVSPASAGELQVAPAAKSAARAPRKWTSDRAETLRRAKQAEAAIGADREVIRGASNQIRVRLRFQGLYEILGLSEAEIAAFELEAADKNLTFTPLLAPDAESAERTKQGEANSMDRIVGRTLGIEYVEPFRAFLLTSDLRDLTAELAVFSLGTGEPMNAEQAAELLQTCLEFRRTKEGATRIELDQVDWEAVAARSQTILTPAQWQLLRAMIDRRKFHQLFQDVTGLSMHFPIRKLGNSSP
jgi:hypothetical protein